MTVECGVCTRRRRHGARPAAKRRIPVACKANANAFATACTCGELRAVHLCARTGACLRFSVRAGAGVRAHKQAATSVKGPWLRRCTRGAALYRARCMVVTATACAPQLLDWYLVSHAAIGASSILLLLRRLLSAISACLATLMSVVSGVADHGAVDGRKEPRLKAKRWSQQTSAR
eukprot:1804347-Pleurochrysis_carterae.AAC.3